MTIMVAYAAGTMSGFLLGLLLAVRRVAALEDEVNAIREEQFQKKGRNE